MAISCTGREPACGSLERRTVPNAAIATAISDLIADINAANAGTGPTTIQLQAADAANGFEFTSAYSSTVDALPQIAAAVGITGTAGFDNTIQRSTAAGTPAFRLFEVTSGTVTLSDDTLSNNQARGGEGEGVQTSGTGGKGSGGGV